ncbi:DUF2516 family protein [Catellatospora coxensis]|uniref:DUF2516 family protein n=1 Tax=Catellatospora coxensis TaxID=310354 RepID=A0A8J3L269_9ACTN|nr:DUF2516 family protein [Catellatospora coxensis]GIG05295.1 hypothetical protein Cco03nite_19950 [Catellatospora coxensis]
MAAIVIKGWIDFILWIFILGILLWAFADCVIRRKEAFPAIGTMPKAGWLLVMVLLVVLTFFTGVNFFAFIGAGVAAYYLLDLRRGLREAAEGPW